MSKCFKKVNHGRIKPKYNPRPNKAQSDYHNYVRNIGCLVCGRDASIHHCISDGNQRISKSHWHITPLCPEHHQGPLGYHGLGSHDLFYEMYRINLYDVGLQILEDYSL